MCLSSTYLNITNLLCVSGIHCACVGLGVAWCICTDIAGLKHSICSHTTYMHTTLRRGGVGRDYSKGEGQFSVVYECVVFIHYVCEGPGMCMYMRYVWGYGGEDERRVCIVYACMLCGCVCARCSGSNEAMRGAYTTRYIIHATRNYAMLCYTAILTVAM